AREIALQIWTSFVIRRGVLNTKEHAADLKERMENCGSVQLVRDITDILLFYTIRDTAYFNLFNIIMFNIALSMNKHHLGKAGHILYTEDYIDDVKYYTAVGLPDDFKLYDCEVLRFKTNKEKKND
ncbi:unnamed protein product, partial [marine sediment metagenome]